MGDAEMYFLEPKSLLPPNILMQGGGHAGGSKPLTVLSGLEVPEYTQQFRNFKFNDRGQETLHYNGPPEIPLQLFTFVTVCIAQILKTKLTLENH